MAVQKQDDQHEHTFSSYVRRRDVVLKTYLGRWTIGRSGERGSGISVLPARYDDDDDIYLILYKLLSSHLWGLPCRSDVFLIISSVFRASKFGLDGCTVHPHTRTIVCIHTHTHIYVVHSISFKTFFVQALKIVVDSWKFSMSLLYILWDDRPLLWFQVQMNSYIRNWNTPY